MQVDGWDEIDRRFGELPDRTARAFLAAFQAGATRITDWERINHRWQNRTGAAEAGLLCQAYYDEAQQAIVLVNQHGVTYGIYLETMQEGRFAILLEAIRVHFGAILVDGAARAREAWAA